MRTRKLLFMLTALIVAGVVALPLAVSTASPRIAHAATPTFPAKGSLDCNGYSKIQQPLNPLLSCAEFGYDGWRGYDNGHYIGHDEPSMMFISNSPGSGNNVQWQISLPKEHALPATQTFENQITFWLSMVVCDPHSYPQTPCIPDSDRNPTAQFSGDPRAAGSAFLELQFYPPGLPSPGCDTIHWCAALTIDSLECIPGAGCNPNCLEPINFAYMQMDGIPTGPPGPASQTLATFTPNAQTLLMGQGDTLTITIKDTAKGLLNRIVDQNTGKTGFMVASAANGFEHLDPANCAPSNFSFHPEFSTAKSSNFIPWAFQANVGLAVETGHFEVGANGDGDTDDAPCFSGPVVAGCYGRDLDFDGTSYLPDWPNGTASVPTSLQIRSVLGNGIGPVSAPNGQSDYQHGYPAFQFATDVVLSETTCSPTTPSGCTAPPPGAIFYPFYAQSGSDKHCAFTFGNDIRGATIDDFGRDAQYGSVNILWISNSGGIRPNPCTPH